MRAKSQADLKAYVSTGSKNIAGWFARTDAEIFRAVLMGQANKRLSGSVVEIGVHHGKSFIAMCLGLGDDEKAYCIDVFQDQHLNKDSSGKGDMAKFESNIARFGVDTKKIVIDPRSSEQVKPAHILDAVGPVRFFSVDGGHWLKIVQNDLRLAECALADHGVIALDDFHRPEWPDVSAGYFAWHMSRSKPIVPFAIGFNKLYLCLEQWVGFYNQLLTDDPFLSCFLKKHANFQGAIIPVYQEYILPEMKLPRRTVAYLRVFHPELYLRVVGLYQAARALLKRDSERRVDLQ